MASIGLRRGDSVEVKSAGEVLATLDERGAYEALPFMAEMIPYCGQRLVVDCWAERMCDTVEWSGSRRIPDTVLLGNLRCDGSGHDRCQGDCRFFWKEAWLRRVEPGAPRTPAPEDDQAARAALLALVERNTRQPSSDGEKSAKYRCQLTELYRASGRTSRFPYFREITSGNVELGRYVPVIVRAALWETRRKLGLLPQHCFPGKDEPLRRPPLDLRPGEWVRVRPAKEIEETIDRKGGTRGLWFDTEMLQHCGRNFRVKERATRFIHDDGTFVNLKSTAWKLENAHCKGNYSVGRWFCPRALYHFWREDWLERAAPPSDHGTHDGSELTVST